MCIVHYNMVPFEWLKLVFLGFFSIIVSASLDFQPSTEFSRHSLIKPKIYHGREKREISSSKEGEGLKHIDHLTVKILLNRRDLILDLRLNRDLIPKNYFEKHQEHTGGYVLKYPEWHQIELCHYNGKIRGIANSWAAVSTCNGIKGVIFDGDDSHYIEKIPVTNETKLTDTHVIYSHSDLISNFSGDIFDTSHFIRKDKFSDETNNRIKRDTSNVRGPYNANRSPRYIELVLVVDNRKFRKLDRNTAEVYSYCKDIVNIVNSLYVPLNIFVALVGVVIWSMKDEIDIHTDSDRTLLEFVEYRRSTLLRDHRNDNAQLITSLRFSNNTVGKAYLSAICSFDSSGGVISDYDPVIGLVAATVAHEMGHNLGMPHDSIGCSCPSERCIMSEQIFSTAPTEWSSCSIKSLAVTFELKLDYCLRNKPVSLLDGPVCGNGFVELGEQCDCGLKEQCNNHCCNPSTCMLYANASCATGECCDLQTCKLRTAGTVCRSVDNECNLPEYCTGRSEYCPEDVFKLDGEPCNNGAAFCYMGNCRSHDDQCRILWGASSKNSVTQCYNGNTNGNERGNCGYDRLNKFFNKCEEKDVHCGMMHCKHDRDERLKVGMQSMATINGWFVVGDDHDSNERYVVCRTALVDLGLDEADLGLAPNGAKCGENKMCLNQKCVDINSVRALSASKACPGGCNGNGVCNNKLHCHCNKGFAPPDCKYVGVGGSVDSGPAADPYKLKNVTSNDVFKKKVVHTPVCGNGLVESGEECDCGFMNQCDIPCCNRLTCMLFANRSCTVGECCNLRTCRFHTTSKLCRAASNEYDLPEYCTGQSEYCPTNVHKPDVDPGKKEETMTRNPSTMMILLVLVPLLMMVLFLSCFFRKIMSYLWPGDQRQTVHRTLCERFKDYTCCSLGDCFGGCAADIGEWCSSFCKSEKREKKIVRKRHLHKTLDIVYPHLNQTLDGSKQNSGVESVTPKTLLVDENVTYANLQISIPVKSQQNPKPLINQELVKKLDKLPIAKNSISVLSTTSERKLAISSNNFNKTSQQMVPRIATAVPLKKVSTVSKNKPLLRGTDCEKADAKSVNELKKIFEKK